MLAERLRALEGRTANFPPSRRVAWRHLIHGFAFAQLLAGTEEVKGWTRRLHQVLLAAVAWLAIAATPLALLVTAQMSFVRYQSDAITLVHQISLTLDLALLLWFHGVTWRRVTSRLWLAGVWSAMAAAGAIGLGWLSWHEAIPPDAGLDEGAVRYGDSGEGNAVRKLGLNGFGYYVLLPALRGDANFLDRLCLSSSWRWTCRFLDVSNRTLIDVDAKPDLLKPFNLGETKLATAQSKMVALSVRDRSFRFADFTSVQVFSADFRGVDARKSDWGLALAPGVKLDDANLQSAVLIGAKMQGASLYRAKMQGALLIEAEMQGASLGLAYLQGADLGEAEMQGASLVSAYLQRAHLGDAQVQGASLLFARMQGASLVGTNLSASDLGWANLLGSSGEVMSCKGALFSRPPIDGESDLEAQLNNAGLKDEQISEIMSRAKANISAQCHGVSLAKARPLLEETAYGESMRAAACEGGIFAARAIISRLDPRFSLRGRRVFHLAAAEALTLPADESCPGLKALSEDDRRELSAHLKRLREDVGKSP